MAGAWDGITGGTYQPERVVPVRCRRDGSKYSGATQPGGTVQPNETGVASVEKVDTHQCGGPGARGNYDFINSLAFIGPLQDNGGPTWTHALLAGSNAIDGGDPIQGCVDNNSVPIATDQRGIPRVVGASCDIGAYEFLPPAAYLPLVVR